MTSRVVFFMVLLFFVFDYFSRFNKTFDAVLPLPLSGEFVDRLFPKTHYAVLISEQPDIAKQYLESIVRKGESFIYFGNADKLKEMNLNRLHIPVIQLWHDFIEVVRPVSLVAMVSRLGYFTISGRPLRKWCSPRFFAGIRSVLRKTGILMQKVFGFVKALVSRLIRKWPAATDLIRRLRQKTMRGCHFKDGVIDLLPIQVIRISRDRKPFSLDFIFESAWFSRYSFIIVEEQSTVLTIIASLMDFLRERFEPHATARKTVHIFWDMETPLSKEILQPFVALSKEANFKLIMFSTDPHVNDV